jgi:hypothetical protein
MEPSDVASFDSLQSVVSKHSPELGGFVKRLKGRHSAPSLAHRFRRLANQYAPDDAETDAADLAAMAKIRNDLLHGTIAELPRVPGSGHPGWIITKLAGKYLALVIDRLDRNGRHRVSIRGKP